MSAYDVIAIGVGGMGSARVFELARRGLRVLGLDRFDLPHEMGSSHGITRIITGSIDAGSETSATFSGSRRSCQQHGLPHEILDARALHARFPGYNLPPDVYALYQPKGGFVMSERAIVAYVWQALTLGAEIHAREQVLDWTTTTDGVEVRTDMLGPRLQVLLRRRRDPRGPGDGLDATVRPRVPLTRAI